MKSFILLFSFLFLFCNLSYSQLLLEENFNYPPGDSLAAHGWETQSWGTPSNPIMIQSPGLTYTGYPSVSGNKVYLTSYGSDNNKTFTPVVTSGNVYVSFLVKVDTAKTGDYFFHISKNPCNTYNYNARIFLKKANNNNLSFGLRKASSDNILYSDSVYSTGTTYLIVLKYTLVPGVVNDTLSLFIFTSPTLPPAEPAPTVGPYAPTVPSEIDTIGSVALRQGSSTMAAALSLDGIRVMQSWGYLVAVNNTREIADKFYLMQNYPNPFNPKTSIEFSIPRSSFVTLKVYDVLGNEITTLVNGALSSGIHRINFDASKFSSGVYYYRIMAGDFSESRKMVLVK